MSYSFLQDKNAALKAAGAIVPDSFEGFEGIIKTTYDQLVEEGQIQPQPESEVRAVPQDLEAAKKAGKVCNFLCGTSNMYPQGRRLYTCPRTWKPEGFAVTLHVKSSCSQTHSFAAMTNAMRLTADLHMMTRG